MTRTNRWLRALAPALGFSLLLASQAHAATCTNSQKVAAKISQAGFNNTVFQEGGSVSLDVNTGGTTPNTQPPGVFTWSQVSGPAVTFSPATGAHTSFTAPHLVAGHAAQIVVLLTVTRTDCTGAGSAADTVTINLANINNFPPVAVASSSPAIVNPGTVVSLLSTGSYDPDNDPINFAWMQVALPGVPAVTLTGANTPTATFVAPSVAATTTFRFRLTVTEGVSSALTGTTTTDVNVVISNQPPVASLVCPSDVNEGATITLNGSGSTDPESGALTYVFSQTSGFPLATLPALPHGSSVSFPAPALGLGQPGNVQFGLTVTDPANASNSKTCTLFIHDVTNPVIAGAANQTLEATSAAGAVATYNVTWTDNVDGGPNPATCVPVSGSTFGFGATTVNCSHTDSAGNTGSASFTVTVADSTKPVIDAHANVTEEATSALGAISNYTPPATSDAVDGAGTANCLPAPGSQFALGSTPVACNAIDSHGNAAIATGFNVLVQDTIAPAITPPANVSAEATGPLTVVAHGVATATDAVGPITYSDDAPGSFPVGVTTIHWGAKDGAGNTSSAISTVTVNDTTAPVVTDNTDLVIEATSAAGAVATFGTPTASDAVDGNPTVSCDASSGATFPLGLTTVTCSATDTAGNTGASSFSITVQDTTPPLIGNVADVEEEATSAAGAIVGYVSPMANDAVDGLLSTSCTPASGSLFPLGDTTVTCQVSDAHGNSASKTFNVKVVDTTPPTVTVPADITAEATGPSGAAVGFSASASDLVDGTVSASCDPAPGSTFAITTTVVTCSATDAHGNTGSNTFNVTVEDTTPPTVTVPADFTIEATSAAGAVGTFSSSASDIVDGSVTTSCLPASGSTFALGTTQVDCSATDANGNTGSASFNLTVEDTTPPAVASHADVTVEATGPGGAIATFTNPSASDLVDGVMSTTCTPASGSLFALGDTTVTCSATDAAGNTGSNTFQVHVVDTTPPVLSSHGDVTAEATGPSGASVGYSLPTASDLVDGSVAVSCLPASGSTFAVGDTTVNCTATDSHGNSGHSSFVVHVLDTTAPVLTSHLDVTVEATSAAGAIATFAKPTASDLVDGSVTVACTPASGSQFALGNTAVSCTATDAHGNTGSGGFTLHVVDTTAPTIAFHADVTAIATSASGAIVTYTLPTASDLVDGTVAVTCLPASGTQFALGSTTVTCTATDSHGNTSHSTFKVIVSFNFTGFFKPIDNLPIINVVKAGQAIPVKFSLGGNMGLAIFAAGYPASGSIACTTGPVDAVEETSTAGGSSLSYDASSGQYIYVWKTEKSWAASCRQLVVKFADGTSAKIANFNFTR